MKTKDGARIHVWVPKSLRDRLAKMAEEQGRSVSNLACQLLKIAVEGK